MKTININIYKSIIAFAILLVMPATSIGGQYNSIHNKLYNGYGQSVLFNEIVSAQGNTIVVFWESNNPRHEEFLEELETLRTDMSGENEFNIIAICTDIHHNTQQIMSKVAGNDWGFDVYVDVNRDFARKNGLKNELHTLFYINGEEVDEMSSKKSSAELIVNNYILNKNSYRNPA